VSRFVVPTLLALILVSRAVYADAGVDLLVLIDRSASTRDSAGISSTVSIVAAELLAHSATTSHLMHRLALVSFGTTVRIDLPFTVVARDHEGIRRVIDATARTHLGRTNLVGAFETSRDLLASLPDDPLRRRAVVLVTDGIPNGRPAGGRCVSCELLRMTAADLGPATIDVFLLNGIHGGVPRGLWQSVSHNRVHALQRNRITAVRAIHSVFTTILGAPSRESDTTTAASESAEVLVVAPYLDVVVFDIVSRSKPTGRVDIYAPDTLWPLNDSSAGVERVHLGDTLVAVTVHRPAPGQWLFRVPAGRLHVKIFSQQFFARGMLLYPSVGTAPRQHDEVGIAYRLVDSNGTPMLELPEYPLSLSLMLVTPAGAHVPTAMVRVRASAPATFIVAHSIACHRAGRYWTDVRITTRNINGRELAIFHDHWSGFTVTPAERIDCRVRAFRTSTVAMGMWTWPTRIAIDCRDEARRRVDWYSLDTGPAPQWLRLAVYREDHLTPNRAAFHVRNGVLEAHIEGAAAPGRYRLHLSAERALLPETYNVCFTPADVAFEQTPPVTWIAIAIFISAAAACLLVRGLTRRPRT